MDLYATDYDTDFETDADAETPVDTSLLQDLVQMFVGVGLKLLQGCVNKGFIGDAAVDSLLGYTRGIKPLMKETIQSEARTLRAEAWARFQRDAGWRDQIRQELGGYWVIKRWRARLMFRANLTPEGAAALARVQEARRQRRSARNGLAAKASGVRTDRSGVFRLAPIARGTGLGLPFEAYGASADGLGYGPDFDFDVFDANDYLGDEVYKDDYLGDEYYKDEYLGDEYYKDDYLGDAFYSHEFDEGEAPHAETGFIRIPSIALMPDDIIVPARRASNADWAYCPKAKRHVLPSGHFPSPTFHPD